jgi:hypothetical protein
VSGTNYTPFSLANGQLFGILNVSGCEVGLVTTGVSDTLYRYTYATSTVPSGAETYSHYENGPSMSAVVTPTATSIAVQQPGFDITTPQNYSVAFPWAAYAEAPNTTVGSFDWFNPQTLMFHIDRLNWSRSGTLVLASKGDITGGTNSFWEAYLQMSGNYSQFCFTRGGYGTSPTSGGSGTLSQSLCTSPIQDIVPNGYSYNLMVQLAGTGAPSDISLYVNGLEEASSTSGGDGFGLATLRSSGGTGYATDTYFISQGGGSTCNVSGYMASSSGVPNGFVFTNNYGCANATFTATGSGTNLTVTGVTGVITYGDTLSCPSGVTAGTQILGQVSGTPGGAGVYTTSAATTVSGGSCSRLPTILFSYSVPSVMSAGNVCSIGQTSTSTTCGFTPTAGSLIVFATPPNITNVQDSNGTPVEYAGTPMGDGPIWYEADAASGAHTFTFTSSSADSGYYAQAFEVKGAATSSPVDEVSYGNGTGTSVSTPTLTTTGANEFLVSFASTVGAGSSWTNISSPYSVNQTGSSGVFIAASGQAPTIGSDTFSATQAANEGWLAQSIAVKPYITTYASTGTGVTLTVGYGGQSMNSTTYPLLAPGYVSAGTYYGVGGTNSSQAPTYVDEYAQFPTILNFSQITNIFAETKFYQGTLITKPANPMHVIVDIDACGDTTEFWQLAVTIGLEEAGWVKIDGVIHENTSTQDAAIFRQMLDQAGMNDVPIGLTNAGNDLDNSSACVAANVTAVNASTQALVSSFPTATTVYREIMAKYASTPVYIMAGSAPTGMYQFMQSGADSISSMTGLQLWARDATNGGAVIMQGGGCTPASLPNTANCSGGIGGNWAMNYTAAAYILANQQGMPLYWLGGTPTNSGPGPNSLRIANDPFTLTCASSNCERAGWNSLLPAFLTSGQFSGGITIGYSGGTGYANSTLLSFTCGGVTQYGYMTASGGVPNGITTLWGVNPNVIATIGMGYGCGTTAPTVSLVGATGTGVTLTAYPTIVCGTDTVSGSPPDTDSFSTASCNKDYVVPLGQSAYASGLAPLFTMWMNSLADSPPHGAPRMAH